MKEQVPINDEKEYEKIRKTLMEQENGKFNIHYVLRVLHEKESLRKTFLSVIKHSPARISEISETSLLTKPTCYSQLFKLLDLGVVDRIFIMPIMNGSIKNDEIKTKYSDWTRSMPDALKRYYLAKTSFWVITNFGKQFAVKAYDFENEFRQKGKDKEEIKEDEK